MAKLRPLDEIPKEAVYTLMENAAMRWIVDEKGVEYDAPQWLQALLEGAIEHGYQACRRDLLEVLGVEALGAAAPAAAGRRR